MCDRYCVWKNSILSIRYSHSGSVKLIVLFTNNSKTALKKADDLQSKGMLVEVMIKLSFLLIFNVLCTNWYKSRYSNECDGSTSHIFNEWMWWKHFSYFYCLRALSRRNDWRAYIVFCIKPIKVEEKVMRNLILICSDYDFFRMFFGVVTVQ